MAHVPAVRRDVQGSWHHCSRAVSCSASFHRTLNERWPHRRYRNQRQRRKVCRMPASVTRAATHTRCLRCGPLPARCPTPPWAPRLLASRLPLVAAPCYLPGDPPIQVLMPSPRVPPARMGEVLSPTPAQYLANPGPVHAHQAPQIAHTGGWGRDIRELHISKPVFVLCKT